MPEKNAAGRGVPGRDPEQLSNLLLVLEHARADAWLRKDRRALDALLAQDFIEINSSGCFTKEDLLGRFFPRVTLHTFTVEAPALVIPAAGSAILTYLCFSEMTLDGKKQRGTFRIAAHYCHDGTRWKLAFWQATPCSGA